MANSPAAHAGVAADRLTAATKAFLPARPVRHTLPRKHRFGGRPEPTNGPGAASEVVGLKQSRLNGMRTFMVDGSPSVLDSTRYAYWCVLQTYAHHLNLPTHRPLHHSKTPSFRPASRQRCISSSRELLSIHRQTYEKPLLRNHLWLLSGMTSLKTLHAAVALNSCLQDPLSTHDRDLELDTCRDEIDSLTDRTQALSGRSNICARAHRILAHLQYAYPMR